MILCPCGHAMEVHDHTGCGGDRRLACACRRDRYVALNDAVSAARRSDERAQMLRRRTVVRQPA
jgi:hypothetical protein